MAKVIVKDYNGHYRIDKADLDACYKLDDLRAENNRLKERIRVLERACDNYDQANCKISRELNETRWQLIEAKRRIEELERISVDWEVVHDDETRG